MDTLHWSHECAQPYPVQLYKDIPIILCECGVIILDQSWWECIPVIEKMNYAILNKLWQKKSTFQRHRSPVNTPCSLWPDVGYSHDQIWTKKSLKDLIWLLDVEFSILITWHEQSLHMNEPSQVVRKHFLITLKLK